MDGSDKMKPLVIWKSETPRILKNVNKVNLPVIWRSNSNAWMTSDIFRHWLEEFNLKMIRQKRKVVLYLDNFSG
jgi:hypothetical protein